MGRDPVMAGERGYARARGRLIETIRQRGIEDLEVLRLFDEVPRHLFVPEAIRPRAYEDAPLPIGHGQTISQPSLHALYLEVLQIQPDERVLEIGTGTGYQTALLAHLAEHVYSIERVRRLSIRARAILDALGIHNVALLVGDGSVGWSKYAPFDAILVAAAAPGIPDALVSQLVAHGGRMLVPVGDRKQQRLLLVRRMEDDLDTEEVTRCAFVPLVGRFGWTA